jgi:hypothetical protein
MTAYIRALWLRLSAAPFKWGCLWGNNIFFEGDE